MAAVWAFSLHVFLVILAIVHHVASDPCTGAGESINGSSGFFSSPNFPNNFPKNSDCIWKITVPTGRIIKVSFLNFTLQPNEQTDCTGAQGARVFITNVASNDGAVEFKLCGQNLPHPVYSVGNFIQVRLFVANNQFSGFNASYMAISEDDLCPTMAQLTEASGVITSPFYPRRYPNNQDCNWKITAKKGNRVKLEITMDVTECGSSCTCDHLEVQNGFDSNGAASGKMCGTPNKVLTYYSVVDTMNVQFFSDSQNRMQDEGFSAIYTQLNYTPPVCPTEAIPLSGNNGTLSSPNYPMNKYLPDKTCTWKITGTPGKRLKFSFTDFALGSCSSSCSSSGCTYVEVYDGNSTSSPLLGRFCHDSVQQDKVTSGNQMFVKFHSGFILDRGFEAQYSETSDGPSPTVAKPTTTATTTTATTAKPPTTAGAMVTATLLSVSLPVLAASIFWP